MLRDVKFFTCNPCVIPFRYPFPLSLSVIPFRYPFPLSLSVSSFRYPLPLSPSVISFRYPLPLSLSVISFRYPLPLSRTAVGYLDYNLTILTILSVILQIVFQPLTPVLLRQDEILVTVYMEPIK